MILFGEILKSSSESTERSWVFVSFLGSVTSVCTVCHSVEWSECLAASLIISIPSLGRERGHWRPERESDILIFIDGPSETSWIKLRLSLPGLLVKVPITAQEVQRLTLYVNLAKPWLPV